MNDVFRRLYYLNRKSKMREELTPSESDELVRLLKMAGNELSKVSDDYARVALTERYINARRWRYVADKFGALSEDTIRKRCSRAVDRYLVGEKSVDRAGGTTVKPDPRSTLSTPSGEAKQGFAQA